MASVHDGGTLVESGPQRSSVGSDSSKRCPDCQGLGEIFGYRNVDDGPMDVTVWPCAECHATGYVESRAA